MSGLRFVEGSRHWIEPGDSDALPAEVRDPEVEGALRALGFSPVCALGSESWIELGEAPPGEEVRERPTFGPRCEELVRSPEGEVWMHLRTLGSILADAEGRIGADLDSSEEGERFLAFYTVCPDGTVLRTVRDATREQRARRQATSAQAITSPFPPLRALLHRLAWFPDDVPFFDRPATAIRTRVMPADVPVAEVLEAHRAFLDELGVRETCDRRDPDLVLQSTRRCDHVLKVDVEVTNRRVLAMFVGIEALTSAALAGSVAAVLGGAWATIVGTLGLWLGSVLVAAWFGGVGRATRTLLPGLALLSVFVARGQAGLVGVGFAAVLVRLVALALAVAAQGRLRAHVGRLVTRPAKIPVSAWSHVYGQDPPAEPTGPDEVSAA